jgi:hypothetical protein
MDEDLSFVPQYNRHRNTWAVRDPSNPTSQSPLEVSKAAGSKLIVLQIADIASVNASRKGIASLYAGHGIVAVAAVISNAGAALECAAVRNGGVRVADIRLKSFPCGTFALFKAVVQLSVLFQLLEFRIHRRYRR